MASCVRGDFVEIQKLVKEINQEYSLDLEKRIIEIEKSACEKCGLDAGFKAESLYTKTILWSRIRFTICRRVHSIAFQS